MKKYTGEEFINKIYKDLHNSNVVMHTSSKSDNKNEKVEKYFDRLERITKNVYDGNRRTRENDINLLKKLYYDKYVIKKDDIPDSYFKMNERIALERGYGHLTYTDRLKEEEISKIIKEQEESLDRWIDYFSSMDTNMYPTWFKYYAFQGMLNLGIYDKEKNEYTRRTKSTVHPFIDVNREALSVVYDELLKFLNKEEMTDDKLKQLITNGNFGKIYGYSIRKLDMVKKDETKSEEGIWKKYDQGSDPNVLFNDIHGKGTGWCTAGGIETATSHIECGDFYVYYTKDRAGNFSNPRIAIRKENNKIAEIRGIDKDQNLESNMEKVVEKKLEENEFPDREEYKKKVNDMEMMTYIYTKHNNNVDLTKNDLKFLYEIDEEIMGFGYGKDPRINEIIKKRDIRKDLSIVFDCSEKQIALTQEEALSGNIVYYYGNLNLNYLESAEGLKLPKIIGGYLSLGCLKSAKGLILPKKIGGYLDLSSLTSAEGLKFPEKVGGGLYLDSLTSAKGLKFPKELGGTLALRRLVSVEDVILPEKVGGNLFLDSLTNIEDLTLPEKIGGSLFMESLTSAEGLKFPKEIGGDLNLGSLINATGITFPKEIGGKLELKTLISAIGLTLPEKIGCGLYLDSLKSAIGLILSKEIGGDLDLSGLESIEGLILPEKVGGSIYFDSLEKIYGISSNEIVDKINFNNLNSENSKVGKI